MLFEVANCLGEFGACDRWIGNVDGSWEREPCFGKREGWMRTDFEPHDAFSVVVGLEKREEEFADIWKVFVVKEASTREL